MAARHEPELETAVYRIVQEAINNAVKHSGSEKIHVTVVDAEDVVSVTVRDEGRGFDPGVQARGFGLIGMRERVQSLGGRLALESSPGTGATVSVRLPITRRAVPQAADGGAGEARTLDSRSGASSSRR
jgi:signal transduction histidine kinase